MAKILYLYAQPHRAGSEHARRAVQMLYLLKGAGHEVDVLSLPGGDPWPEGLVRNRFLAARVPCVRSLPLYGRGFRRIWASIVIFLAAIRLSFREHYDAIHCSDRAIRCCGVLSWLSRKPFIFEWHTTHSGRDLMRWLSKRARCFRRSVNMIFSDIPYPLSRLRDIEVNGRIAVLQVLPSPAIKMLSLHNISARTPRSAFRLVAIGMTTDLGDLNTFCETLPTLLAHAPLHVEILGSTPRETERFRTRLQQRLGDLMGRVAVRPALTHSNALLDILESTHLVFMPAISGPIAPAKLIDVMAARRAILAIRCPAYQTLLDHNNAMFVTSDAQAIAEAILQHITDTNLCHNHAQAAYDTITKERNLSAQIEEVRRCYALALGENDA